MADPTIRLSAKRRSPGAQAGDGLKRSRLGHVRGSETGRDAVAAGSLEADTSTSGALVQVSAASPSPWPSHPRLPLLPRSFVHPLSSGLLMM